MAKVITLQVIVRDDDTQRIEEGLKDMFASAQSPVDPDALEHPWLASWSIKNIKPVNEEVEMAVTEQGWQEWKAKTKDYITQATHGLIRYKARVVDTQAEEQGQLKEVELWAASDDDARELVEKDYAYEDIVSVKPS